MNIIEQLGNQERFSKTFCLFGFDKPASLANAIKEMANLCAENGYRISKADRTQNKVVLTFEKLKP